LSIGSERSSMRCATATLGLHPDEAASASRGPTLHPPPVRLRTRGRWRMVLPMNGSPARGDSAIGQGAGAGVPVAVDAG
jgi:hypothetical protein